MTNPTTLALADRCEQAAGPNRDLDFAIAAGVGWPDSPNLHQHARRYTESLDAAVTLYLTPPEVIPSCPRKASAAALRARAVAYE
jgi:hypothetical protein